MNEHDKLFKKIQSIKENAEDLIESTFPIKILKLLDLTTLKLNNNNYIDDKLKEFFNDLVYNCRAKNENELKITFLFEHKSKKPPNEYLQLLHYQLNVWKTQQDNNLKLTLIIPVIIYHSSTRWEFRKFSHFFKAYNTALFEFLPQFRDLLTDLTRYNEGKM